MSNTVKKVRLIPMGDKTERDRVYKYLRDGMYNQHHILNTYASQVGCLYYKYNKDFKNPDFKEEYNAIFRNTNEAIKDFEQAKGLGMAGSCGMKVKQDFSTALKNGLAKGERKIPQYKRDFPLIVPGRFLNFYVTTDSYETENGEIVENEVFAVKFVNGIHFKVVLGSRGKRDYYLPQLLDSIINDPENYKVCGSSIQFTKKGNKIILNLNVKINKKVEEYKPVEGRIMAVSMGYDKCLVAALSDSDKVISIGDNLQDSIVEKRIQIQDYNQRLQAAMRNAQGGHGRDRKMRRFDQRGHYESNVVRHFNHVLSKMVIGAAKKNKAETIILEDIDKSMLENYPILLRNWSYDQLQTFISYKAGNDIVVRMSESKDAPRLACCKCGTKLDSENILPKEIEWCHELSFTCPNCKETIEYSYNKAKNMTVMS
ncbi:MAG: hypothetical protein K6E28_11605 [Eubacterium sp.]|nr:hypothetical protein [Eubacterium sp.]